MNISNSLDRTTQRQQEYINNLNKLSDKLSVVDDKMSTKFEKMYDMINSLDKSSFHQVTPKKSNWVDDADEAAWGDWDWSDDEDADK